ncbi:Tail tubular protein Gp11 [uncultured Caudovirales phage]|uniref:Tail tubular protein Gp11 n=1 Tax=uncultured Caudovirales phage TaxID=2100421 RepID=A0A6J5NGQ3_9CAUD|nr:Tail tubular protein Gp11 [uncultured Caudovirales phage]CAB5225351.1 Tail tubular protein Gp11 [uncultured Caudovirales phage]
MPITETDIVNRALVMIGQETVINLTGDSRAVRFSRLVLPQVRDELLRSHPWKFATRRVGLPASATPPAWGAQFSYPLPPDCLRVLGVQNTEDAGWRREGNAILTDLTAPLNVIYIASITDPNEWNAHFQACFVARLAMDLAAGVAQSGTMREQFATELRRLMREARSMDAMEASSERFDADDLIDARRVSSEWWWR